MPMTLITTDLCKLPEQYIGTKRPGRKMEKGRLFSKTAHDLMENSRVTSQMARDERFLQRATYMKAIVKTEPQTATES